jgi:hypothetical protein
MNKFLSRVSKLADELEPQFGIEVAGKVVLIDGDSFCYESSTSVTLDTALRKLASKILEVKYLTNAEFARVHLTPEGCEKNGRGSLLGVKPYQGNRKGIEKPALLELIRTHAPSALEALENVTIISHYDIEADDALMMECYELYVHGKQDVVLVSPDKDLRIAPCPQYEVKTGGLLTLPKDDLYGWIDLKNMSSSKKVVGHGQKFFWAQMLMGDTADNVKGVLTYDGKLCGAIKTYKILKDVSNVSDAANLVLDAYRAIDQNPLPEGEALWLLRDKEDSFYKYVTELDLSPSNFTYINNMLHSYWRF